MSDDSASSKWRRVYSSLPKGEESGTVELKNGLKREMMFDLNMPGGKFGLGTNGEIALFRAEVYPRPSITE